MQDSRTLNIVRWGLVGLTLMVVANSLAEGKPLDVATWVEGFFTIGALWFGRDTVTKFKDGYVETKRGQDSGVGTGRVGNS